MLRRATYMAAFPELEEAMTRIDIYAPSLPEVYGPVARGNCSWEIRWSINVALGLL